MKIHWRNLHGLYGDQVVEEMEHEGHHILNHIHGLKDIEEILENGLVDHLENWHSLGAFDEDDYFAVSSFISMSCHRHWQKTNH